MAYKRTEPRCTHIDYFVEIVNKQIPMGLNFAVQLKGTENIKIISELVSFSMKTQHLKYYYDSARLPVYLIVFDVISNVGYWISIQEYLHNLGKSWRSQKSFTVKLPTSNTLDNFNIFHENVIESEKFVRELWPSSILASTDHVHQTYTKLDPRIKLKTIIDGSSISHILKPTEDIPFKLHVDQEVANRIDKLITDGTTAKLNRSEFDISGSDLFEKLLCESKIGELIIEKQPNGIGDIVLETKSSEKESLNKIYGINCGIFFYENNSFEIKNYNEDYPLRIRIHGKHCELKIENQIKIELKLDYNDKWANKVVTDLPNLVMICDLLDDVKSGADLFKEVVHQCKSFITLKQNNEGLKDLSVLYNLASIVNKLFVISKKKDIILKLPTIEKFDDEAIAEIETIYYLIAQDKHEEKIEKNMTLSFNVNKESYYKMREEEEQVLSFKVEGNELLLLGEKINMDLFQIEVTAMDVQTDLNSSHIEERVLNGEKIIFELKPTVTSKKIIKFCS